MTAGADCLLEQLVASACRVVGAGEETGSIVIVAGRRLTFQELARARDHAARCGVDMTMDGHGTIALRRHGTAVRARLDQSSGEEHACQTGDSGDRPARCARAR